MCCSAGPVPAASGRQPAARLLEVAGVIESGDADSLARAGTAIGDAVCALVAGGGYAEQCVAPVAQCLPVPEGWGMNEAAGLLETFFTVWSNLFDQGAERPGQVLVHGGSSGIGVAAIQLPRPLGPEGLGDGGQCRQAAACRALGADGAINSTKPSNT